MHDLQQFKIIFYFPRESDAEEHKIDENACVMCQGIEGDKSNPLQAVKKGLTSLITYSHKFHHIVLEQHLLKQEQLEENDRTIKFHKSCQRNVYN